MMQLTILCVCIIVAIANASGFGLLGGTYSQGNLYDPVSSYSYGSGYGGGIFRPGYNNYYDGYRPGYGGFRPSTYYDTYRPGYSGYRPGYGSSGYGGYSGYSGYRPGYNTYDYDDYYYKSGYTGSNFIGGGYKPYSGNVQYKNYK